ncbi:hypothetical protein MWG07_05980 [Fusobacterium necrophorum]|uniref:Uncharacterized protein n=2 Tax=root TaxID=1 RepID=A0AAW6WB26_9FUSO|nr:hypothetical protein [Fusobacterium necrophorum]DAD97515.1 MAG TPA: hypothetical protein [Caudovirales sp. ctIbU14]KYM57033.1 hypothetical protein A2U07_01275 [Fusobacterium necrophorum subsp. funduliforme]MCF0163408.1 hypothetical protein [Fusobacterium necrophorum]MDK4475021.1 hypothetical protein [Fusobacterium necrophorum]MDK4481575.1 hypothetical protein [Fusobacterium necrophorum]
MAKTEKKEELLETAQTSEKTYIYLGKNIIENGFIVKHKSLYTEEQMKRIRMMKNYKEYEKDFVDLDEYSKNY